MLHSVRSSALILYSLALLPPAGCGHVQTRCAACAARTPYAVELLAGLPQVGSLYPVGNAGAAVYTSDRSGAFELWLHRAAGDDVSLTTLGEQVQAPQVSRDGRWVVFASDYGGNEREDLYRLELASQHLQQLTRTKDIAENAARFSPDGTRLVFNADPDQPFRPHVFVLELASGKQRQLTRGEIPVRQPIWSPDGSLIAAVRTGDWQRGDLLLIPVDGGPPREVAPPPEGNLLWPLTFLDGGTVLATTQNAAGFKQLALVETTRGTVRRIGPAKWDVGEAVWQEGVGIIFSRNVGGRLGLYRLASPEAASGEELLAPEGELSSLQLTPDGRALLFVRTSTREPASAYRLELATKRLVPLASTPALEPQRLARASHFAVRSFDGTLIDGLLYVPPVARLGRPYPAIAWVHGGPNGQSMDIFSLEAHALTQAGFVVLAPNYRGSTGYGKAFEDLNNKDWGGGDLRDVRAVIEHFAARGLIDGKRVGISGGSYGGYLTLMALVSHPDCFRAGVDAYGMHDLIEDYRLTKDRFGLWYETEMGTPEQNPALFAARSPIQHLRALRGALLVFQGANDTNVPKVESDRMVQALRRLGRDISYVVYPDEGHGFTRRPNRVDYVKRMVAFFTAKLR